MSSRKTVIFTLILIALSVLLSLVLYARLPAQVASHWNASDQVDGSMPRFWGAFSMPLMALAMLGLFLVIPVIDPLKANIAEFRPTFNLFIVLIVAFLLYVHVLTLLWNIGVQSFRMSTAMLPAMGLLFIMIGMLLRRAKRNFFIGIRTPWTLASDRVWAKTHRLGALLFVVSGFLAVAGVFLPGPTAYLLVIAPVLASTLVTLVYSYVLWREEQTVH